METSIDGHGISPWSTAFSVLRGLLRRHLWMVSLFCLIGAVAAVTAKTLIFSRYTATAQILVDPRGLKIFSNDLTPGQFDANAAYGYAESQMGVMLSESVLLRVIRDEPPDSRGRSAKEEEPAGPADLTKRIDMLRKSLTLRRADRSFVIDVTASARTPERAAWLANAVVRAYMDEDAQSRAESARKVAEHLTSRLATLRKALSDSEAKAEKFRLQNDLIDTGRTLVVEKKLSDALTAAATAQAHLAKARARVEQLAPASPNLGSLGADADSQRLALLLDRQNAAREELASLATSLGNRHPALVSARSRVAENSRRIAEEIESVRGAAKADLNRAVAEQDEMNKKVQALTAEVGRAREAEIQLRTLEQDVDANRKLLEAFETRSREAGEFGQIDSANLRVISVARAPEPGLLLLRIIVWGIVGSLMGLFAAIAMFALIAFFRVGTAAGHEFKPAEKGLGIG